MPKLWLEFKSENGDDERVEVDRTPFVVGRHSECGLTILDGRLSREHIRIEWKTDKFVASDMGSSNGTTLNDRPLTEPVGIRDKDTLNLGGVEIRIVLEAFEDPEPAEAGPPPAPDADVAAPDSDVAAPAAAVPGGAPAVGGVGVPAISAGGGSSGIPTAFFFIAPLLGVFVLAAAIGAAILFGGGQTTASSNEYESDYPEDEPSKDTPDPTKSNGSKTPRPSETDEPDGPDISSTPGSNGTGQPPREEDSETARIEQYGAAFVRLIAQNDPNAFLTGEQAAKVNIKVKQFGRSSALADNINEARKNAAAIKGLAKEKNLKPQFLAVAALTKLGNTRGDVLKTAETVADVYDQLRIQIGSENFDDALLMVAAYDHGVAGETMKMRNMLQGLAAKSSEGPRTIRSIWFLEKNGKITAAEYERALTFLAIGTIGQNPKEFGVNAEALRL
ncbi:MAG: FHA domain-containing protein [Pyrinomonadaceae bacterium]